MTQGNQEEDENEVERPGSQKLGSFEKGGES
jgi:hypothetical protein